MTTIAVNREMMAGDSQMTSGDGTKGHVTKIYRVGDQLLGIAGSVPDAMRFVDWYRDVRSGREPDYEPNMKDVDALILDGSGIWLFNTSLQPIRLRAAFAAIGSGSAAALGAMYAGADPRAAVRIAAKIDAYTGGSIKTYRL